MGYKMLVLDLDDTLLDDDYKISQRNKDALKKAQEQGVYVVLASGRPTAAMMNFACELELGTYGSFIISFNGGMVTNVKDQEVIFERSLTKEEIHDLHDFSKAHKVDIITYLDGHIVSERRSKYIDIEIKLTGMNHREVSSFKSAVDSSAVKCILLEDPAYLKSVEAKLREAHPDMSVAISKPFFLEVMPQGIDKAASIAFLAKRLGINREEIIAVGNAGNDVTMIEYAGLGVWVSNVAPELRSRADVIVASNNDDGVAEVVERFILG